MLSPRHLRARLAAFAVASSLLTVPAAAQQHAGFEEWPAQPPTSPPEHWGPVSPDLEEIQYPHPVHFLELSAFGQDMRMAYMDVPPSGPANGQTVVLLHGMNFYGEAYGPTINELAEAGFRVIAPDQIGFGKSSKPIIPYTFNFLVANTKAILDELGIERAAIVGHSMGGMVAARFALHYPETTTHLALVNQIGLEDGRLSRPFRDPGDGYNGPTDKQAAYTSALRGQQNYYPDWYPPQLEYVRRWYGHTLSGDYPHFARVRSLLSHMTYSDPVVYDWQHIDSKTLVIGGEDDELAEDWAGLARNSAEQFPNAALILYPGVGHNPQHSVPEQFHGDLIRFLRSDPAQPASAFR